MIAGAIIFARLDSTRLPGKALLEIAGRPLLLHVIERARRIDVAGPIVVATSDRPIDDAVAHFARCQGVDVFRGALENVAGRALAAAETYGLDAFARVCGDRPFFDPMLATQYAAETMRTGADLVTNADSKTFPPGLTTEIVRTSALRRALEQTHDANDREHVTRYFYRNPKAFYIRSHRARVPCRDVSLAVDTPDDLARARFIARYLGQAVDSASIAEMIACARKWRPDRETIGQ